MMLDDKERFAAASSLIDWFESQGLKPADAAAVMSTVLAIAITQQHKDVATLYRTAETFKKLYLLDISEQLRMEGK